MGIAGGIYIEYHQGRERKILHTEEHIPGALQLFRRQCLKEVRYYPVIQFGGDDTVIEAMARMKGWETRSFHDIRVVHHRPLGMGSQRNHLIRRFKQGMAEYEIGSHPLFVVIKNLRYSRLMMKPYILGSLCPLIGYMYATIKGIQRSVSDEFVKYWQNEQMQKLQRTLNFIRVKS